MEFMNEDANRDWDLEADQFEYELEVESLPYWQCLAESQ